MWRRGCRGGLSTPTSGRPRCGSSPGRPACSAPPVWRRAARRAAAPGSWRCRHPAAPHRCRSRCCSPRSPTPSGPTKCSTASVAIGRSWWVPVSVVGAATVASIRRVISRAAVPVVADGDALHAIAAGDPLGLADRTAATVLTPHDGEFAQLTGTPPGPDRLEAARALATRFGCTVLLKGPATVIADETGDVLVVDHGDERLATAGAGDVLAGMIGALLAAGQGPLHAAATAAWLHADAARRGPRVGLMAGDVPDLLPATIAATITGLERTAGPMNGADRWAWAEIDLGAVAHNIAVLRAAVAPAAVWAVVKADGYGHGAVEVGRAALEAGAEGLCVALVAEGVALREAGIDAPILVLSEQPIALARTIVAQRLTPDRLHPQIRRRVGRSRTRPSAGPPQDRHRDAACRCASPRRGRTRGVDPGTVARRRVDRRVQPSRRRRRAGQPVHRHPDRHGSTMRSRTSPTGCWCTSPTRRERSLIPRRVDRSSGPASPCTGSPRVTGSMTSRPTCARSCR